jgi:hypothetical protein
MLATVFGQEKALHYWCCFRRLLNTQRAQWPWLNQYMADSPRRAYDMLDVAATELILLADQHPGADPLTRGDGSSLAVQAWAEATRWAYREAQCNGVTGAPRCLSLDAALDPQHRGDGRHGWLQGAVRAALAQEAAEPEDLALDEPEDHPRVSFAGLTAPQVEALAAYAAGINFSERARLDGRSSQAVRLQYRTAVRRLLRANPWLADLYDVPAWMLGGGPR